GPSALARPAEGSGTRSRTGLRKLRSMAAALIAILGLRSAPRPKLLFSSSLKLRSDFRSSPRKRDPVLVPGDLRKASSSNHARTTQSETGSGKAATARRQVAGHRQQTACPSDPQDSRQALREQISGAVIAMGARG